MNRSQAGKFGEDAVAKLLESKGYYIAARNYRIKGGEVDIIGENNEYIIFVEVKTRKKNSLVSGYDAITENKKRLIIKTAADYCWKNPTELQPRFDTAQVIMDGDRIDSIDYIPNAFDTTGYKFIF